MAKIRFIRNTYIRRKVDGTVDREHHLGVMYKGTELEVEGPEKGELLTYPGLNSSNQWYSDKNGLYYWGGGVEEVELKNSEIDEVEDFESQNAKNIDYNELIMDSLNQFAWAQNQGKNQDEEEVKIGIIDEGFDLTHPCFEHLLNRENIKKYKVSKEAGEYRMEVSSPLTRDKSFTHGNQILAIMAANGGGFKGIVPRASYSVISCKGEYFTSKSFDSILKNFERDLDILITSLEASTSKKIPIRHGKLILISSIDNIPKSGSKKFGKLLKSNLNRYFPSNQGRPNQFICASLFKNTFEDFKGSNEEVDHLDFLMLRTEISGLYKENQLLDSSFVPPIAAAVIVKQIQEAKEKSLEDSTINLDLKNIRTTLDPKSFNTSKPFVFYNFGTNYLQL